MFVVDSVGRSGALILLWRDGLQVDIQNYSRRHINATITQMSDGIEWKFTGFYEHPEVAKRKEA